ncbi:MAG: hypothetical protein NVSMB62_25700 [Acidobacteriaceae bacterium]
MGFGTRHLALSLVALWSGLALASGEQAPPDPHRNILVRVPPAYPELARRMHVSGYVVMVVDVRHNGTVSETHVESGHAMLRQAAEDAVRRWRFAPGPEAEISVAVMFNPE